MRVGSGYHRRFQNLARQETQYKARVAGQDYSQKQILENITQSHAPLIKEARKC